MKVVEEMRSDEETIEFVRKSFESVLKLHNEIVESKNQNINQLKEENDFLKKMVLSLQEVSLEDRETIDLLSSQINSLKEELEFTKRKYKLMWNKAVENYTK